MDEIRTYKGYPAPPSPLRAAPTSLVINPAAVKTTSNYVRALRRRVWAVLALAVPLAIAVSIYVLRLPPVYLAKAEIEISPQKAPSGLVVRASVTVTGQTGVEMEALTAVSVACLTIYDMVKAVERGMRIEGIRLIEKSGGKSGRYRAKNT